MSNARLRLQQLLLDDQDRLQRSTQQGIGTAVQGLDRFEEMKRFADERKRKADALARAQGLEAATLTAAGIQGGTNPATFERIKGGRGDMTRERTPQEKLRALTEADAGKSGLSPDALAGLLVGRDPLVDLKRRLGEEKINTQVARTGDVGAATKQKEAATATTNQKREMEGLEAAVKVARERFLDEGKPQDSDGLATVVNDMVENLSGNFPGVNKQVVRGLVADEVYDAAEDSAKNDEARKKTQWDRAIAERKWKHELFKAKKTNISDAMSNTLRGAKNTADDMLDLKKQMQDPRISWEQFAVGANELGEVTGSIVDGFVTVENIEKAMARMKARFENDNVTLAFLEKAERVMYSQARTKNGVGVMTDTDLRFWQNALFSSTQSKEQFENSVNDLMFTGEREYQRMLRDADTYYRALGPDYAADLKRGPVLKRQPVNTGGSAVGTGSRVFNAESPGAAVETMGNIASDLAPPGMGGAVRDALSTKPGSQPQQGVSGSGEVPVATSLSEAKAYEQSARARLTTYNAQNPAFIAEAEQARLAADWGKARNQLEKFQADAALGSVANPKAGGSLGDSTRAKNAAKLKKLLPK